MQGTMRKTYITILLFVFAVNLSNAQFLKNSSLAVGLSTTQILGNNPGALGIQPSGEVEPYVFGGGFIGAQPGLEIRLTIPIDEERRWRIPVGIDYQFYSAKERIPVGHNIEHRRFHSFDVITPYIGLSYVLQELNFLKTKTYLSFEFRSATIKNIDNTWIEDYYFLNSLDTTIHFPTKPETTRIGGIFRAGVEGILFDPVKINASVGISLMNLIGRNDSRRELLTPFRLFEVKESYVWNLNFSILFQYTL